jgi:hypothetical protein
VGCTTPVDVCLIFENFPVWLVGLEPSRIRQVHILGFATRDELLTSLQSRGFTTEVLHRLLNRFGSQRVMFHESTDAHHPSWVTLVSGSLTHTGSVVASRLMLSTRRVLGVIDHHFYGRLRNGRPSGLSIGTSSELLQWTKVQHESVGGVSTFVGLFCTIFKFDPVVTVLQRSLQHVVDHGIRPTCIRDTDPRFGKALTFKDRIHPSTLDKEFIYPTHFCCSGWGWRRLTTGELCQVYGLPMICRVGLLRLKDFDQLIPAHLFHAVFDELCLDSDMSGHQGQTMVVCPRLPLFKLPCASRSWIPAFGRWLSHSWIYSTHISTTAAKRDDALVATALWDKRLMLLYPKCTSLHLDRLRTWLLIRVRRSIFQGLRRHLVCSYGTECFCLLIKYRKQQRLF